MLKGAHAVILALFDFALKGKGCDFGSRRPDVSGRWLTNADPTLWLERGLSARWL